MTGDVGLDAHLLVERGPFRLDLPLPVAPGEVVALLGPNGAGKSTALAALAGLLPLSDGHVRLGGRTVDDPRAGHLTATRDRRVGMVFQDYLLFPHLSVLDNIAFGLRARGVGRRAARQQARGWLDRVGLDDLGGSRPGRTSGGQAQRIALARALVTDPDLLLLDEPLSALDASTRPGIRSDLAHHLGGYAGCTVLVTHDALDAMVLADRIVVLEAGRVVQQGTPAELARTPRTPYVAQLVGLNLHRGSSRGTTVDLVDGGTLHTAQPTDGAVFLAYPPAAVALHRHRPEGSARNTWPGRVAGLEHHGSTARVRLDATPPVLADVTTAAVAELRLQPGQDVWASVKATEIHAYPR
ncbi:ABC transporter ATP-binding protein [Jannaschia sp. R86511]|uniref:ABC transporter ATP-binding protein n=1 Tax=Jannaschia sp. R86511 TaxID=3093853 RepID=UPI0036D41413